MVHVGEQVTVKVLKFDREKERISLGLEADDPGPVGEHRRAISAPQNRVIGRVVSVTDYGAFVELEPGVEGLIHISEMTWSRRMKHPAKVVKPGDQVEAVVLEVKPQGAPHFAGHQATGSRSLDHGRGSLQHRFGGGRARPQAGRFRRVCRN